MFKQWIRRHGVRASQGLMSLTLGAAVIFTGLVPLDAEAKRLGGNRSQGMQRDMPARTAPDAPPARPAQPAQGANPAAPAQSAAPAAAGAAAAAGKRSWMGPIAGLAAGLGIAALFSSLGLGAELANFVMLALLGVALFFLVRFVMARMAGGQRNGPALAGAAAGGTQATPRVMVDERPAAFKPAAPSPVQMPSPAGSTELPAAADAPARAAVTAAFVPASFDSEGFARIAKMIFIRMQAANDAADLNDLRRFTTPEMFAAIRLDIQERNGAAQTTDVQQVDAQVLDVAEEDGRQIVSVRFTGRVIEEAGAPAESFDEVWHLVKDAGAADNAWAIAGIEQGQPRA
jgi:predicted lipid-binding transport protein (Tim44 family)